MNPNSFDLVDDEARVARHKSMQRAIDVEIEVFQDNPGSTTPHAAGHLAGHRRACIIRGQVWFF